jgi:hypothetical protein
MDPDALIQLKVYKGDHGLPIGDLHKLTPQSELLLELHEVADAASGDDTLGIVYTRSNAEREAVDETENFGCLWSRTLWGHITFWPYYCCYYYMVYSTARGPCRWPLTNVVASKTYSSTAIAGLLS